MLLKRARIVRSSSLDSQVTTTPTDTPLPMLAPARHRRIARDEVQAHKAAREILAGAKAQAAALVAEARRAAGAVAEEAAAEARQAEQAKLAALYLRMRDEDERRADRDLDRTIALAVLLAERLVGTALVHDPTVIVPMAHQALAEARGSRRAIIEASPSDAEVLQRHLAAEGFAPHAVEIRVDPEQSRGSLRVSTNLGTLDAQLRPQLERLANALRDTLRQPSP